MHEALSSPGQECLLQLVALESADILVEFPALTSGVQKCDVIIQRFYYISVNASKAMLLCGARTASRRVDSSLSFFFIVILVKDHAAKIETPIRLLKLETEIISTISP